jgi:NAD(P)-dependent dehydrogenase (short-subunit alcohol dehydrogenase family)
MAAYYAPHKIRVNAIAPSLVRTDLTRRAQGDEQIMDYVRARQPLADAMIEPEEIAQTSLFLLSDESRNITGELITVDGGWCVSR